MKAFTGAALFRGSVVLHSASPFLAVLLLVGYGEYLLAFPALSLRGAFDPRAWLSAAISDVVSLCVES